MAVSAVNALACVPRRGSDRIGSGRVRGGTGQCRFPPASFDISVETETGGAGCTPGEKGGGSMAFFFLLSPLLTGRRASRGLFEGGPPPFHSPRPPFVVWGNRGPAGRAS